MKRDRFTEKENVDVDRDALTRQARATLFRTRRNAGLDLREKPSARRVPEDNAPGLSLFVR